MNQTEGQGQYEGQGGSYVVGGDGDRKLIERTRDRGDPPAEPQEQPASAGIFSPEAPADQPTAE